MRELRIYPAKRSETPLPASARADVSNNTPETASPLKRNLEANTGMHAAKAAYRAAFEWHADHYPPTVVTEYWATHSPGDSYPPAVEEEYWSKCVDDACAAAHARNDDPFFISLISAVYDELAREYDRMREQANAPDRIDVASIRIG